MSLKVRELHHQAIRVPPKQADEVQHFYEDVLGMETDPNRPDVPIEIHQIDRCGCARR